MKRTMKILKRYMTVLALLSAAACSSGGGGDSTGTTGPVDGGGGSTATTLNGVVADGYLRDARVFLDRNGNRTYDNGEPAVSSGAGGQFSLAVNSGDGERYPVVVDVIAGQTVDEDSGVAVAESYQLEAPAGRWQFVSPLTTLVKIERDKNPAFSEQQAVLNVVSALGVDGGISVFDDYLDRTNLSSVAAAEYGRTHKAAQVVAGLMGQLRESVRLNLGGTIADNEMGPVACLVSDQVMAQADRIRDALNGERNFGTAVDVAATVAAAAGEIQTERLNVELVALYQQRLNQNLDLWDMQPPGVVDQSPAPDANAPVSAVVVIAFDEILDETLLSGDLIEVVGPNGPLAGQLEYLAEQNRLMFVPDQPLLPSSLYQVHVSPRIADQLGNPLGEAVSWSFSTVFSETPPALPEIL